MARTTGLIAMLALVAAGGCESLKIVPCPKYAGWVDFGVGSYVTFEGVERVGNVEQRFRMTEKLLAASEDEVALELTMVYHDDGQPGQPMVKQQWLKSVIFATEDPTTHPDAKTDRRDVEMLMIGDEPVECEVTDIALDTQFLMLGQKLSIRLYSNESIPGRVVKVAEATATTDRFYYVEKHVVAYRVADKQEEQ